MKKLFAFALLITVAVSGCAVPKRSTVHYSAPTAAPVRESVTAATKHVEASTDHARKAVVALQQVQDKVTRQDYGHLQPALAVAGSELTALQQENKLVTDSLTEALIRTDSLQKKVDVQTSALNRMSDEKNAALDLADKYRSSSILQTKLAWKWRLIAFSELLCVGAFFAARQYFPILKFI